MRFADCARIQLLFFYQINTQIKIRKWIQRIIYLKFYFNIHYFRSYNILTDPHLANFFNSPRMKQHLIKTGLVKVNCVNRTPLMQITKEYEIISEKDFRNELVKKSQRDMVLKVYSQAMIDRALEMERSRRNRIRQNLETITISHRIRKIKACLSTFSYGSNLPFRQTEENDWNMRSSAAYILGVMDVLI